MPTSIKFAALAAALLAAATQAHNFMMLPLPTWPEGFYARNNPCAFIDPAKVLPVPTGQSYTTDAASNTKAFWTAFNASSFKSVKQLINKGQKLEPGSSAECGFSLVDGTPRDLPDQIQWDFFTASHEGPFEVYCDDKLVFKDWDAAINFPEHPAITPYDKAKCKGAKMLTSYWLALHTVPWQVYMNCAPLTGSLSPSNSSTSDSSGSSNEAAQTSPATPAETPAPTTAAPTPTTPAPTPTTPAPTEAPTPAESSVSQTEVSSAGGDESDEEEETDEADNAKVKANKEVVEADVSVPTTPAPAVEKCTVRRRRRN
uniref:Uncharacterized protein n=1 Tax=Peronospora matthiolae TaxID=2874970 RepID=A0AAV1T9R8_9STRA